jgi:phage terminase large subunit-like protein
LQYADETWSNHQLGLRIGAKPRALMTTTPRPIAIIRQLLAQSREGSVHVIRGNTCANAPNLVPKFIKAREKSKGTRLGRQELHAEVLDEFQGADLLEEARFRGDLPEMIPVVVGIDP